MLICYRNSGEKTYETYTKAFKEETVAKFIVARSRARRDHDGGPRTAIQKNGGQCGTEREANTARDRTIQSSHAASWIQSESVEGDSAACREYLGKKRRNVVIGSLFGSSIVYAWHFAYLNGLYMRLCTGRKHTV